MAHSGFNVYCEAAIWPNDESALENLAHYVIRAAFSQERMNYIAAGQSPDGIAKVICQSKDGTTSRAFDALDWLTQLTTHIPGKNESHQVGSLVLLILQQQITGPAQTNRERR